MNDYVITAGATSRRIGVWLADSSSTTGAGLTGLAYNSAGLTCYYWREDEGNANATAVTLATATRGTFTSSGFIEKDATNLPGAYEFGLPNAAIATGAKWVKVMFKGATNLAPRVITIKLASLDMDTASVAQTGDSYAVVNSGTYGNAALKTLIDAVDDYVDSEVAAIKAKTDNLPAAPAATGDIPTANQVRDAILAAVIEGAVTLKQSLQLSNAAAAGKVNGAETTTVHLRDLGDTKNRITATVDADGNRSAVTPSYD